MIALTVLVILSAPPVELVPVSPVFKFSISGPTVMGPKLEVRNRLSSPVEIWESGWYPNHQWQMTNERGRPVKLTKLGEAGAKRFGSRERDKNLPFLIAAGKAYRYSTPPLAAAFELEAGTYALRIMYHEKVKHKSDKAETAGVPDEYAAPELRLVCAKIKVIVTP